MKTHRVNLPVAITGLSLVFASLLSVSAAETKQLPTVSVAKTEPRGIGHWQPAMGEGLANMLITELSKLDNMKVLESVALEDLREERRLGEAGEVAASEAVKKGQWKGADYTLKSVITEFGNKENSYGGGGGIGIPTPIGRFGLPSAGVRKTENRVRIDWRLIDNTTREIVKGATGSAVGIEGGTSFNFSSFAGHGFANNREFMDSALGKATIKAVNQIVDDVKKLNIGPGARTQIQEESAKAAAATLRRVTGTVDLVDGKEIWVSLGAKNGFAKGDKLKIYKPLEKKNAAGKVVLTIKKEVGELVLVKVQSGKSMGVYDGSEPISENWIVADAALDIDSLE